MPNLTPEEEQELKDLQDLEELEALERIDQRNAANQAGGELMRTSPIGGESFDPANAGFLETVGQRGKQTGEFISGLFTGKTGIPELLNNAAEAVKNLDYTDPSLYLKIGTGAAGTAIGLLGGPVGGVAGAGAGQLAGDWLAETFGLEPQTSLGYKLGNAAFDTTAGLATTGVGKIPGISKAVGKTSGFVGNQLDRAVGNTPFGTVAREAADPDSLRKLMGLQKTSAVESGAFQGLQEAVDTLGKEGVDFFDSPNPTMEAYAQKAKELKGNALQQRNAARAEFEHLYPQHSIGVDDLTNTPAYADAKAKAIAKLESGDPAIQEAGRSELARLNSMVEGYRSRNVSMGLLDPNGNPVEIGVTGTSLNLQRIENDLGAVNEELRRLQEYDAKNVVAKDPSVVARNEELKQQQAMLMQARDQILSADPTIQAKYNQANKLYGAGSSLDNAFAQAIEGRGARVASAFEQGAADSVGAASGLPTGMFRGLGSALGRGWNYASELITGTNPEAAKASALGQRLNQNAMQILKDSQRYKANFSKGGIGGAVTRLGNGVGSTLEYAGMFQAAVPSNVNSEVVVNNAPLWAEQIARQASIPMSGEDPQTALQRGQALASDFMHVMQNGHDREKRAMIANMQKMGFLPPNPVQGEVDGFIELPEDRQKFIQNMKADVESGKMSRVDYIKQLNAMSDPNNGRIITSNPLQSKDAQESAQRLLQTIGPMQ